MTPGLNLAMAVVVGLFVAGIYSLAISPLKATWSGTLIVTAFYRLLMPLFFGYLAAAASNRHDWFVVSVFAGGSCALLAVSAWQQRRKRG